MSRPPKRQARRILGCIVMEPVFVTLREQGDLRGCIGSLEAARPLGEDIACHTVDAASHDPRFRQVEPWEYPGIGIEVSVLSPQRALPVSSRAQLEASHVPRRDGLVFDDGHGHRTTFLPQVWDQLPRPHDFVGHLLAKSGGTCGRPRGMMRGSLHGHAR